MEKRILIAVTGASGSIYAERLVDVLRQRVDRVYLLFSETGAKVVRHELSAHNDGFSLAKAAAGELEPADRPVVRLLRNDDLFAPVASGSSAPTAMVILPASMGCIGRIAHGVSGNLVERSADVCMKQKRPLIICPRESPLNAIHLRNMLELANLGCHIVPAMPGFYQRPENIGELVDFMVGRVMECLGMEHDLYPAWNSRMR
ncbi:MAG: UbiX family flavin prenyltransferase [Deltaproteobacteria bacterium]|nr:UbiX family flavin prenyltransferase [Deltaproteobacteria bacterium]